MRAFYAYLKALAEDIAVVCLTAFLFVLAGALSAGPTLYAQGVPTALFPATDSLTEFALRQGGALAILLVVLFYYRRDYRDLVDYRSERDKILVTIIQDSSRAKTEMADAMRENNRIVQAVFQDHVAQRNGYPTVGDMLKSNP